MRLNITSILLFYIIGVNRSLIVLPQPYVCTRGECMNPSGECARSVLCFANPCEVSSCPGATSCEANYCGGCHAVFKDANGVVINPANCARRSASNTAITVGCGINHCTSYNDGCNMCSCTQNGVSLCTMRACLIGQQTKAFCTACEPGYMLNPSNNECEPLLNEPCICTMQFDPVCCSDGKIYGNQCEANCQQATGCNRESCIYAVPMSAKVPPITPNAICGGFANCATYYDGCNNCMCGEHGVGCTRRYCVTKEPSKCTSCKTGYTLLQNQCVPI